MKNPTTSVQEETAYESLPMLQEFLPKPEGRKSAYCRKSY